MVWCVGLEVHRTSDSPSLLPWCSLSKTSALKCTYHDIFLVGWGGLWNSDFRLFFDKQARQSEKLRKSTKPPCQTIEPYHVAGRDIRFRSVRNTVESHLGAEQRVTMEEGRVGPIHIVIEILIDEVTLCEEGERKGKNASPNANNLAASFC